MGIKIGHASIDENGKIAGGKVGDQTTKEICTRIWYDKDWDYYIECTDTIIANKASIFVEQVCANPNYGYDQSDRLTGYVNIVKNGGKVYGAKGEFDCSSLIAAAYILAGLKLSPSCTTRDIRRALFATDKFKVYSEARYLTSDRYAKRGGIYLKEGSHIVMALENGASNPYPQPTRTIYYDNEDRKVVCDGDDVKFVQFELREAGITIVTINGVKKELKIDGSCGQITDAGIRRYQTIRRLVVDGKCGPKTIADMINR
jgi:peptidoglycan hydrolase-like protein with peptidoglycan-binding domain